MPGFIEQDSTAGSAIFLTIVWSNQGTVADLAESTSKYKIYTLFLTGTGNTASRFPPEKVESKTLQGIFFSLLTPLLPREKTLSSSFNEKQLIDLVFEFAYKKIADVIFSLQLHPKGENECHSADGS